jgi:hypothetical protein
VGALLERYEPPGANVPRREKERQSQSLRGCTRDEAAQPFAIRARDVIHVTDAPLYEDDKILRSICRTLPIIGVANGNLLTTSIF